MADFNPCYPHSFIEDDFNYGSCVASASVHIHMGRSTFPRPTQLAAAQSPQEVDFRVPRESGVPEGKHFTPPPLRTPGPEHPSFAGLGGEIHPREAS
ncbi:Transmembrane BAX inhibitor motif-containing protein 4 [Myotis davidii]|uniref:Transmembrane BAX inhibitor motif-containing protein 4 n=1 Tax=Myotis davidii TaxID=225400 RepID=L5LIH9_MYODS|nr:Transmembrane BAX inhibitor motif-containing protein 4 [Myotis davidii]